MTVSSATTRADYQGNNVTTLFTVPFYFLDPSHLKVLRTDNSTTPPTVATLALNSDYTATGAGVQGGGQIQATVAPTGTQVITILRNVPFTQLIHYVPNDPFPAATHEQALDQLTMEVQETEEQISRTIAIPINEVGNNVVLPPASVRAGRAFVFDALGGPGVSTTPFLDATTVLNQAAANAAAQIAAIQTPTFQSYVPLVLRNGTDFTAGTSQSVTLPATTAGKVISGVFMDGVFQSSTQYTINGAGTLLTFSSVIPAGIGEIDVMYFSPSLLGLFTQNGYGATPRPFQSKMQDSVSAFDFMSQVQVSDVTAGTLTQDVTAAINAALNSGAKLVTFPAGSYLISAQITLPYGVSVRGAGPYQTLLYRSGAQLDFLEIISGSQVKDMGFQRLGTTVATGGAVLNNMGTLNWFSNIQIGYCFYGLLVNGTAAVTYAENLVINGYQQAGIQVNDGPTDVYISKAVLNQGTLTAVGVGINIQGNVAVVSVDGAEVIGGKFPLVMDAPALVLNQCPAWCRFTNCFFDSSIAGVQLNNCMNTKFTGCWFSSRPGNGCTVNTADTVTFEKCDFINNALNGCLVTAGSKRVRFLDCVMAGNSTASPGLYHGVAVAANTTDFSIVDCTLTNQGPYSIFGAGQGYGAYINVGASDRYIVTGNLVNGNLTGGISDNGTGVNKTVGSNF